MKRSENCPNKIRSHRERCGLTLVQLGTAIRISKQLLGAIERGDRNLTLGRMREIAQALGLSAADLLSDADNPNALSESEKELIALYRSLDSFGRRYVTGLAGLGARLAGDCPSECPDLEG